MNGRKLPVERGRKDGARMRSMEGKGKREEGKEKVSVGGERYIKVTIMSLILKLVDKLEYLEVIVKLVDLLRRAHGRTF